METRMRRRTSAVFREAKRIARQERLEQRARLIGAGIEVARRGKYHNVKATYGGGGYDSMGAAEHAHQIDLMPGQGKIVHWERPKPVALLKSPHARGPVAYRPQLWSH